MPCPGSWGVAPQPLELTTAFDGRAALPSDGGPSAGLLSDCCSARPGGDPIVAAMPQAATDREAKRLRMSEYSGAQDESFCTPFHLGEQRAREYRLQGHWDGRGRDRSRPALHPCRSASVEQFG
jgi:hypothetical protein